MSDPLHKGGAEIIVNFDPLGETLAASSGDGEDTDALFFCEAGAPALLIGASWTSGDADFVLTAPDGTEVKSSKPKDLADATVRFFKDASRRYAVFTVRGAISGSWSIAPKAGNLVEPQAFAWRQDPPPTFAFDSSLDAGSTTVAAGSSLAPLFLVGDPTDSVEVAFWLSPVLGKAAGRFIGSASFDPVSPKWSSASLNVPSDLSPGRWYLCAVASDGRNTPRVVFAGRSYVVTNAFAPAAPAIVSAAEDPATGGLLVVLAPTQPAPFGVRVYWSDTCLLEREPHVVGAVGDAASVLIPIAPPYATESTPNLPAPGTTIQAYATAVDENGAESAPSASVQLTVPADPQGYSAPQLAIAPPTGIEATDTIVTATVAVVDADGLDDVTLAVEDPVPGLVVQPHGPGEWQFQFLPGVSGTFHSRILLADGQGHSVTRDWTVHRFGAEAGDLSPRIASEPGLAIGNAAPWINYPLVIVGDESSAKMDLPEAPSFVHPVGLTVFGVADAATTGPHRVTPRVSGSAGNDEYQPFEMFVGTPSQLAWFRPGDVLKAMPGAAGDVDTGLFYGLSGSKLRCDVITPVAALLRLAKLDGVVVKQFALDPSTGGVTKSFKIKSSGLYTLQIEFQNTAGAEAMLTTYWAKLPKAAKSIHLSSVKPSKPGEPIEIQILALPGASVSGVVAPSNKFKGSPLAALVSPDGGAVSGAPFGPNDAAGNVNLPLIELAQPGKYLLRVDGFATKSDAVTVDLYLHQPTASSATIVID